jgi:hypothetical protein
MIMEVIVLYSKLPHCFCILLSVASSYLHLTIKRYANFQYLTEAFMFSLGRQWKQAIYTNCTNFPFIFLNYFILFIANFMKLVYFCAWWGVTVATSIILMLSFQDIICPFLQVLWVPDSWRYEMVTCCFVYMFKFLLINYLTSWFGLD